MVVELVVVVMVVILVVVVVVVVVLEMAVPASQYNYANTDFTVLIVTEPRQGTSAGPCGRPEEILIFLNYGTKTDSYSTYIHT